MKITAYLLAFNDIVPIPTREIDLDTYFAETADNDCLLDMAFQFGQNDFQPKRCRSLSVGDVVKLPDGSLHRVLGCGWEHLPAGTDINKLERGAIASCR